MPALTAPATEREVHRAVVPAEIEWRDSRAGDGSYTLLGHAAVTDTLTTLWEGTYYVAREQIAPGAFTSVLAGRPDVHLNLNHDMARAIARTGIHGVGELDLSEDAKGLRTFARLDPEDPDVQALAVKMRRGIVNQMSFAFAVGRDEVLITEDERGREVETRTILEVSDLFDVCVCAQGAYPTTDASLRTRALARERELAAGRAGSDPAAQRESLPRAGSGPAAADPQDLTAPACDPAAEESVRRLRASLSRRMRLALSQTRSFT